MADCYTFQKRYTEQELAVLNKMHTKQLLKERNRCYASCGSDYYVSSSAECSICLQNQKYNIEQIKKILATREHVPNKQESKELRKKRIKEGK